MNKRIQKKRHTRGPFYVALQINPKNKKRSRFRYRCLRRCIIGYNWRIIIHRWQYIKFDWKTKMYTVSVHKDRLLAIRGVIRTTGPLKSRKLYTRSY